MKLRTKLLAFAAAITIPLAATAQIWGPVVAGLVNGGIVYGAGGVIAQDSTKLFWDGTNHRLGIGNAIPAQPLDVTGNVAISGNQTIGGTLAVTGGITGSVAATGPVSGTNGTFTGTLGVTGVSTLSSGITGSINNTDATTGIVGEELKTTYSLVAAGSTGVYIDAVTLSLTAGDWSCAGVWYVTAMTAASTTNVQYGLSIGTAGNSFSDGVFGDNAGQFGTAGGGPGAVNVFTIPDWKVRSSSSQILRAKFLVAYSAGSPVVSGRISCRRMR